MTHWPCLLSSLLVVFCILFSKIFPKFQISLKNLKFYVAEQQAWTSQWLWHVLWRFWAAPDPRVSVPKSRLNFWAKPIVKSSGTWRDPSEKAISLPSSSPKEKPGDSDKQFSLWIMFCVTFLNKCRWIDAWIHRFNFFRQVVYLRLLLYGNFEIVAGNAM